MNPRILLNKHRHAPYKWRCTQGKHNGYGHTPALAYAAFMRNLNKCIRRDIAAAALLKWKNS